MICIAGGLVAVCLVLIGLADKVLEMQDWTEAEKFSASLMCFMLAVGCGFWAVTILFG
jgi:hypothetical protein